MKASGAKELFRQLAEDFFRNYMVVFTNQSRMPKSSIPLVVLTPGNVRRPQAANTQIENGKVIGFYLSQMPIIVDLFTNGEPVKDDTGTTIAYANSAIDEILAFADYLNSPACIAWCNKHDVSILIEADAQDLTGIINDTNYEYRSRIEVLFAFTQRTDDDLGDMGHFNNVTVEATQ